KANVILVPATARHARDDLAPNHDWTGRVAVSQFGVRHFGIPNELTCTRVYGNDVSVTGCGKDLVAEYGQVSLNASAGIAAGCRLTGCRTILPDQIARRRIQCLNDAVGIREVHDVDLDRRYCLILSDIIHLPGSAQMKHGLRLR